VSVAMRTGARLVGQQNTDGTGDLVPLRFVGAGIVLGAASTAGGHLDTFDVWFPALGGYHARPKSYAAILAAAPDGSRLYGLAGASYPCLTEIRPDSLEPTHLACEVKVENVDSGYVSPDGRWLALAYVDRVELYDLQTLWTVQDPVQTWWVKGTGLVWLDASSFVVGEIDRLVRFAVDQPGRVEEIGVAVPAGASLYSLQPIPTLDG